MTLLENPNLVRHWRYFLYLESDLERALRYVDPGRENRGVYSLEFARLLLSSCSQFETVSRLLVARDVPGTNVRNIAQIYNALEPISSNLHNWSPLFLPLGERLRPFETWAEHSPPAWWKAYNSLKHDAVAHLTSATLQSVLEALGAVGVFTTRYCAHETGPWEPRLFDLNYG